MGGGLKRTKLSYGFTIVELLIVIIVIAILATLVITAYNGVQQKARDTKVKSDVASLIKVINIARLNSGQTLRQLVGDNFYACYNTTNNPNQLEPKQLPKSNGCWTRYYSALTVLGQQSGTNLDGFKAGDPNGNPYAIYGQEGYPTSTTCNPDFIRVFTGNGVGTVKATTYDASLNIPFVTPQCT